MGKVFTSFAAEAPIPSCKCNSCCLGIRWLDDDENFVVIAHRSEWLYILQDWYDLYLHLHVRYCLGWVPDTLTRVMSIAASDGLRIIAACQVGEMASGTMREVEVGDGVNKVLLVRTSDGAFSAIGSKCR